MRFTVLVAADLYGDKVNLELTFPTPPSVSDLQRLVETTFSVENSALRPQGHPFVPFRVMRFQIFDDRVQAWTELVAANQIAEYAQIYAFQRDATLESQKQIPPARKPTQVRGVPASSAATTSPPPVTTSLATSGAVSASSPYASASSIPRQHTSPSRASPSRDRFILNGSGAAVAHGATSPRSPPRALSMSSVSRPVAAEAPMTYDNKLRAVFDELDANGNRLIELEEFRKAFRVLNLDLPSAVVTDLFARGDADRDGVISLAEFHAFAGYFPTLVDSIFYRSREHREEERRKDLIDQQLRGVQESKEREQEAKGAHAAAHQDVEQQEATLHQQEQNLQAQLVGERDARQANIDAKKDVEKAHYERAERERDLQQARERERQRHAALTEVQRGADGAQQRVTSQEGELARAQEKVRQLEAMLADARREEETQVKALQSATADLSQWREREQGASSGFSDSQQEVQRTQDHLSKADTTHASKVEGERDAAARLTDQQRESARQSQLRDEEERALQQRREQELHTSRVFQDSSRQVEDSQKQLQRMEQDMSDYLSRRKQVEAQELPLLEQEIQLREQRFALEEKEGRFRNETASFQSTIGRSPGVSVHSSATVLHASQLSPTRRSPPRN